MGKRRVQENSETIEASSASTTTNKRTKLAASEAEDIPDVEDGSSGAPIQQFEYDRPKSKKELRAEKKRARRLQKDPVSEQRRLQDQQRKKEDREEFRQLLKEERLEKKRRQQKRLNRERNSPGNHGPTSKSRADTQPAKKTTATVNEEDVSRKVMDEIKYGKSDMSGWTTLPSGVKLKDVATGTGPLVQNRSLLTVKYQLTGGKFGAVIDSSNKFHFVQWLILWSTIFRSHCILMELWWQCDTFNDRRADPSPCSM